MLSSRGRRQSSRGRRAASRSRRPSSRGRRPASRGRRAARRRPGRPGRRAGTAAPSSRRAVRRRASSPDRGPAVAATRPAPLPTGPAGRRRRPTAPAPRRRRRRGAGRPAARAPGGLRPAPAASSARPARPPGWPATRVPVPPGRAARPPPAARSPARRRRPPGRRRRGPPPPRPGGRAPPGRAPAGRSTRGRRPGGGPPAAAPAPPPAAGSAPPPAAAARVRGRRDATPRRPGAGRWLPRPSRRRRSTAGRGTPRSLAAPARRPPRRRWCAAPGGAPPAPSGPGRRRRDRARSAPRPPRRDAAPRSPGRGAAAPRGRAGHGAAPSRFPPPPQIRRTPVPRMPRRRAPVPRPPRLRAPLPRVSLPARVAAPRPPRSASLRRAAASAPGRCRRRLRPARRARPPPASRGRSRSASGPPPPSPWRPPPAPPLPAPGTPPAPAAALRPAAPPTPRASPARLLAHQAEAEAEALVARLVGVAQGAAAAVGVEIPAAAADHPLAPPGGAACVPDLAGAGAPGARVGDRAGRVVAVPVLAPLPDVAVQVVEPPAIGGVAADRRRTAKVAARGSPVVGIVAVVIGLAGGQVVAGGERRRAPGPAGVLPLRLGWQPEAAPRRPLGEAADEGLHVLVADALDRTARPAARKVAGVGPHDRLPLPLRDLVPAEVEGAREEHLVRRLVRLAARLPRFAPHSEAPRAEQHELHPGRRLAPGRGARMRARTGGRCDRGQQRQRRLQPRHGGFTRMVDGPAADLMPSPLPSPRPPQARDRAGGLKGKAVYPTISTWAMIAAASRRDASKEKTVAAQALLQDLRFAARFLLRRRGASALALAALACGIGATSAIWSVVDTVLLQPLPYRGEILVVRENIPGISDMVPLTAYELVELRAASRTLAGLAAADLVDFTLLADGAEPASVAGARVTPDFFALLGVRPAHGRTFVPQDAAPGAPPVAVVGYAFYAKRFGADPDLAGKSLRTQSATALGSAAAGSSDRFQIVGVLPPEFRSPFEDEEIWTPLAIDRAAADRVSHTLFVLGKARPGEALPQVRSELDTLLVHLEPGMALHQKAGRSVTVVPLAAMLVQNVRGGLLILFAAVSLVLLIVCANVANLLLAQALARQREMAQRAALGAGRPRLLGQMLVESLLLALAGGAAGLALAYALLRLLVAASPGNIPRLELVGIDLRVLAFTVAITLGCGLLFGLVPAWRTSRLRFHEVLKSGGRVGAERSHERLRGVLVIAQVALTVLVVVGALLLYRSFRDLQTLDYGFRSRGVLTATIDLPDARYPQPAQQEAFFRRLLERIKGLPGVRAAGMVNSLPLSRINTATTFD